MESKRKQVFVEMMQAGVTMGSFSDDEGIVYFDPDPERLYSPYELQKLAEKAAELQSELDN